MGHQPLCLCLGHHRAVGGTQTAYTTIATYLKMLYERGYVDFFKNKGEGKTHMYVAKIGRAEYTRKTMQEVKKNFFDGSVKSMLSFFVKEENLTAKDIQELLQLIEEEDGSGGFRVKS